MKKSNRRIKPVNATRTGLRDWQLQTVKTHQPESIVQFFRESPLVGVDLDLKRDKDTGRDIAFWR